MISQIDIQNRCTAVVYKEDGSHFHSNVNWTSFFDSHFEELNLKMTYGAIITPKHAIALIREHDNSTTKFKLNVDIERMWSDAKYYIESEMVELEDLLK